MRYTLAIILFSIVSAFSQENVIDTIYKDTHKVTYIIDTLSNDNAKAENTTDNPIESEEDLGLKAPPNKNHRLLLHLTAQSLSFSLGYEYMFSDFWSIAFRLGYTGYDKDDIRLHTDVNGTIDIFTSPVSLRWIWGRRNIGKYHYVDALGNNHHKRKSQAEGFIQISAAPTLYNLDVHRDSSAYKNKLNLNEKEFAAYITAGFGFNLCYESFILTTEMNFGTFVKKPKFQEESSSHHTNYEIYLDKSRYGTHLLEKTVIESIIAIGWMF